MRKLIWVVILMALVTSSFAGEYQGRYVSGKGDVEYLKLIDQSFGYFHPNPDTPNISMLYYPEWDCLIEGASWGAWWIQNSFGPTYCALPFLQEPWLTFLQHSQDMWFNNQGDGKTKREHDLIGPDGCLCDAALPNTAHMVQGDCNWPMHDWGFEFTAAGVVMQAEMLLIGRDKDAVRKYLPNLERACNFIETRRDENGLFLVGPAANLLAPSYGGIRQADGTFGKGYLAGLSVNYLAALDRMIELQKLVGSPGKTALYEKRRKLTSDSLAQIMTPEGYFVKSMEKNGTRHGVYGQEKWGYFEAAPNVDAICFRAVDQAQSEKIYAKIASIPQLRPHDFLITNYPSLDDTYENWGGTQLGGLWEFGRWVNGGFWATMEARAIMAYYRLGKYEDVRRSNAQAAKFVPNYQMDAPLTDFGNEVWFKDRQTNLCYDALGIPAATVRGLFEYVYRADELVLIRHIPPTITEYTQKEPIRWGTKTILITWRRGRSDGARRDSIVLKYDQLPGNALVEIDGKQVKVREERQVTHHSSLIIPFPESLSKPYAELKALKPKSEFEKALVAEAIRAFEAYSEYASKDTSFKPEKQAAVLKMYEDAAMNMYKGIGNIR